MQKTLFNGCSANCCAYCNLHHCGITAKQMKIKECLKKQCWHLVKNEMHPYWKQRATMKQKRAHRKSMINQYVSSFAVQ